MKRLWGPVSRGGRCTGISPGTCRVMNRERVSVARAQGSSCRRAGDRRGQTRPREDPASSPPRAICSGVAASSCNPRLPGRVWSSVGAALRPGRAAGIGGAGEPGRPASLRGVDRLAPHGCLPPLPLASSFPNFLPLLPAISSSSSAVWCLRAPFVPPEQLGSQALLGGEASAGHGRSVGREWENRGAGRGKPRLPGARHTLLRTRSRGSQSAGIFPGGRRAQRRAAFHLRPGLPWVFRGGDLPLYPGRPRVHQGLLCNRRPLGTRLKRR